MECEIASAKEWGTKFFVVLMLHTHLGCNNISLIANIAFVPSPKNKTMLNMLGISKWSLTGFLCKLHDTFSPDRRLHSYSLHHHHSHSLFYFFRRRLFLFPHRKYWVWWETNKVVAQSHVKLHISCCRNCVDLEYTYMALSTDWQGR